MLQSIELAVAAEELNADGAYFRVHHFARPLGLGSPTCTGTIEGGKDRLSTTGALRILLSHLGESALYDPRNLFAAVSVGDLVLLEAILARHSDPDFVENDSNVTPLMVAVDREASDEMLHALIRHGADCWKTDRIGDSPLSLSRSDRVSELLRKECSRPPNVTPE